MKFKIINTHNEDSFTVEGSMIEDIQKLAKQEIKKRGWKTENCFSEEL